MVIVTLREYNVYWMVIDNDVTSILILVWKIFLCVSVSKYFEEINRKIIITYMTHF